MTDVIPLDYETRSPTNIRKGLDRYVGDPGFGVMMLSFWLPGEQRPKTWHRGISLTAKPDSEMSDRLAVLHDHVRHGGLVSAWNAMFEWMVWNLHCVPVLGWPELRMEQMRDTMARAAAMNLPQALGKCAEVLGLPADLQKDKRGKYLIQRLCCPHKPTKNRPGIWIEDQELFDEFVSYCDQDVITEVATGKKLRPLTEWQQQVWVLTQKINRRGVPVALDECQAIDDLVESEKARLNKELSKLTAGAVPAASKRNQLLAWCNERAAAPLDFEDPDDDDDADPLLVNMKGKTVEAVLKRDDLPADVRRALEIRAAVCQTSTAKYRKMLSNAAPDGTLKGMFVWHGAGPGRWSSKGGINVQNFARPTLGDRDIETAFELVGQQSPVPLAQRFQMLFGDLTMDAAVSCLRGVLKAPPGYEFIDADFSSIENRMAAFIAGQHDKLEMFAKGLDEYKTFASKTLFKVPYDAVTKDQRQFTKPVILGGIFGLGWRGLVAYAEQYGVKMTDEEAQHAVKGFRADYNEVRLCWYSCGDASIDAVQNPGKWFTVRGGKLRLICHKNFLWMELPSGRLIAWARPLVELKLVPWTEQVFAGYDDAGAEVYEEKPVYRDVVTVESIDTKTRVFKRHPLIGSSIFQSGVQGSAADILAEGTVCTEAAGYQTVLLAHDENLSLVRQGWGDPDEFGRLLCTPRHWRMDLPLAYEAWRGIRFRK